MAKQTINLGTGELTGDGESIRSAFDKINNNFDELYTQDSSDVVLSAINASLIPDTDVAYDLGSATNRFRDLYLSGSTIDLGGTTLSIVGGNLQIGGTDIADVVAAAGASPFDQDLNTTDNPQFNRVGLTAGEINVVAGTDFNLYVTPDGVTSHNLNFGTDGTLTTTSFNGTLTGNVVRVHDEALTLTTSQTGPDPTPWLWNFTNTYGSGLSISIPRADWSFIYSESYGIASATITGTGFGDGVTPQTVSVDDSADPIVITVSDPEADAFVNGENYALAISETVTQLTSNLTFGIDGTLTTSGTISVPQITGVGLVSTPVNGDLYIVSANEGGTVTNVLYNNNPTYGAYQSHQGTVDFSNAYRVLGPDKTPASSIGAVGDKAKEIAFDANYIYYCTADYDSVTNIWKRVAWSGDTW